MKITDIRLQKKRQDRYNIFIDEEYACSLSGGALLESGIRAGDTLSSEQKQALVQTSDQDLAYSRLLDLIARRPRSIWEAEQYLKKKGYDAGFLHDIINLLKQKSYLDDYAFTESWIRSRRLTRSISQKKLRFELQQKRIDDSIIDECMSRDEKDDAQTLQEIVAKKRKQSRYQDDTKLMRYLAGQGFYYSDIKAALDQDGES